MSSEVDDYLVIIKADNLGAKNELVKFTEDSKLGLLVPCYEETPIQIKLEISNILRENKHNFSDSFVSHLSTKFSNDSSINNMEFDKLRNFLINNNCPYGTPTAPRDIHLGVVDHYSEEAKRVKTLCGRKTCLGVIDSP